jgi:hypothetical protein
VKDKRDNGWKRGLRANVEAVQRRGWRMRFRHWGSTLIDQKEQNRDYSSRDARTGGLARTCVRSELPDRLEAQKEVGEVVPEPSWAGVRAAVYEAVTAGWRAGLGRKMLVSRP